MGARVRRRKAGVRQSKEVIAFLSEGEVTEPEYVRMLRGHYGIPAGLVKHIKTGKSNPLGIVREAVKRKKDNIRRAAKDEEVLVNEWWVLFDTEGSRHPHARIPEALRLAEANDIRVAMSDPSFELWLLLHFRYTTRQYLDADETITDLRKEMPEYRADHKYPSPARLMERIDNALENAERLRRWREGAKGLSSWTDVDRFVTQALRFAGSCERA